MPDDHLGREIGAVPDPALHDRSVELLRHALEVVTIREEPGSFVIGVDGAITGMVSLALGRGANAERAVLDERTARSVLVVAGAGNQLWLLTVATDLEQEHR